MEKEKVKDKIFREMKNKEDKKELEKMKDEINNNKNLKEAYDITKICYEKVNGDPAEFYYFFNEVFNKSLNVFFSKHGYSISSAKKMTSVFANFKMYTLNVADILFNFKEEDQVDYDDFIADKTVWIINEYIKHISGQKCFNMNEYDKELECCLTKEHWIIYLDAIGDIINGDTMSFIHAIAVIFELKQEIEIQRGNPEWN